MANATIQTDDIDAVCLFSGPGGSSFGLRMAGISHIVGVEWEADAVATARAAGFTVEHADVRGVDIASLLNKHFGVPTTPRRRLVQGSPPCQGLSRAGNGQGRHDLDALFVAIDELTELAITGAGIEALQTRQAELAETLPELCSDERSPLTFEVTRWMVGLDFDYVMLEQVPAALPIWEKIAELLAALGYSVWTGNVQSEQFGVPQTRKRAILLATRHSEVLPAPAPTHSKYHSRSPERLDEGVDAWVSMAEALGWGVAGEMVSNYGTGGDPKNRGRRRLNQPAPTVTSKIGANKVHVFTNQRTGDRSQGRMYSRDISVPSPTVTGNTARWKIRDETSDQACHDESIDGPLISHIASNRIRSQQITRPVGEPAFTVTGSGRNVGFRFVDKDEVAAIASERVNNQSGSEFDMAWPAKRPSMVIAGRDLVTMPGANANRFNGSTKSRNDGIRVTIEEAGVLQSFPADYPW